MLVGRDTPTTCSAISMIAGLPQVQILAILIDSERLSIARRLRNLKKNVRREGWSYLYFWLREFLLDFLESLSSRQISRGDVFETLRQSFPGRAFTLGQFEKLNHIPVLEVGNLNGLLAAETLRKLEVDLGIVLGTRILKRSTFSIPRMGCINLHKGKVPEYRGMPPGFWELYDGRSSAGVTVHFVDDGLDTGDIVGEDSVLIRPKDSPRTLRRKLDQKGNELLVRCVLDLAKGQAVRRPQPATSHKTRTSPTRHQQEELEKGLGLSSVTQEQWIRMLKTFFYLTIFYTGFFHVVRGLRKILPKSRGCILLYHRVNDLADDVLTVSPQRFTEHLLTLKKYYTVIPSSVIAEKVRLGEKLPDHSVAIHFDDCYRDVYTQASPILVQLKVPASAFVSSGFVGTERIFQHDADKYPIRMENLRPEDLSGLTKRGFEIGSHTVNHVDLGQCGDEEAYRELVQSKHDLETILARPVLMFSFPFGRKNNIREKVPELVRQAGYQTMFSAHGGYVTGSSDPFNLCRMGVSEVHRPLDLLMEIEGLSLGALKMGWKKLWPNSRSS